MVVGTLKWPCGFLPLTSHCNLQMVTGLCPETAVGARLVSAAIIARVFGSDMGQKELGLILSGIWAPLLVKNKPSPP